MDNSTMSMFNETQECNHNETKVLWQKWDDIQIIFMIINCIIGPIGIVCNLLSIVVLVQKSLRNVFHDLLLSLACFDLFYLFLRLCLVVAVYRRQSFGITHVMYLVSDIGLVGSIYMTCAISLERYLCIFHPSIKRKSWYYFISATLLSIAYNLPKFFELDYHDGGVDINKDLVTDAYVLHYKHRANLVFTMVIPKLFMIFANARILIQIIKRYRTSMPMSVIENDTVNDDFTACVILVVIVTIFLICHAIRTFLSFRGYYLHLEHNGFVVCFDKEVLEYLVIGEISRVILNFNSSINFFVYCLVGKQFRKEFIRVFCNVRHCSHSGSYTHKNEENDAIRMEEITLAGNLEDENITL